MTALVLRAGPFSALVARREAAVSTVLVVVAALLGLVGLCRGVAWTAPQDAIAALFGYGDSVFVIQQRRAPRVAAALVFGAALALAGALFQALTRNPLGSPDIIGLDSGAYTGALVAVTMLSGTATQLAIGSAAGGLLAALVVLALSTGAGISGMRMIVIGIAVNAILTAVNSWIVLRAELDVAIAVTGWSAGSLNGMDWDELYLPLVILSALSVVLLLVSRAVRQSMLGDEVAATSGVAVNRARLLMVVLGVGFTATVTAAAGPIVFIALAAPQIGRRLARSSGAALIPAALTGAVVLLAADLLAQQLLSPVSLPVGVVTTAVGGCYLLWLLVMEVRRS